MKRVVITGSTRGIGRGLAEEFLSIGCAVTISGRSPERVADAVGELAAKHDPDRIHGHACDVAEHSQVEGLWQAAALHWGGVDIWINNAGISHLRVGLHEQSPDEIEAVISTNLLGSLYGSRVALGGMREQGYGALYNMEGMGSDGQLLRGLGVYGTSKRGIRYLGRALAKETDDSPVITGVLSPGMVVTDLLMREFSERPEDWASAKRVFNILAERVETVTPWLARRVLANERNGARIVYLTKAKAMARFLTAGIRKRNLFV